MDIQYLAEIFGGYGPDVWVCERVIQAASFEDAVAQAIATANKLGGKVRAVFVAAPKPEGE